MSRTPSNVEQFNQSLGLANTSHAVSAQNQQSKLRAQMQALKISTDANIANQQAKLLAQNIKVKEQIAAADREQRQQQAELQAESFDRLNKSREKVAGMNIEATRNRAAERRQFEKQMRQIEIVSVSHLQQLEAARTAEKKRALMRSEDVVKAEQMAASKIEEIDKIQNSLGALEIKAKHDEGKRQVLLNEITNAATAFYEGKQRVFDDSIDTASTALSRSMTDRGVRTAMEPSDFEAGEGNPLRVQGHVLGSVIAKFLNPAELLEPSRTGTPNALMNRIVGVAEDNFSAANRVGIMGTAMANELTQSFLGRLREGADAAAFHGAVDAFVGNMLKASVAYRNNSFSDTGEAGLLGEATDSVVQLQKFLTNEQIQGVARAFETFEGHEEAGVMAGTVLGPEADLNDAELAARKKFLNDFTRVGAVFDVVTSEGAAKMPDVRRKPNARAVTNAVIQMEMHGAENEEDFAETMATYGVDVTDPDFARRIEEITMGMEVPPSAASHEVERQRLIGLQTTRTHEAARLQAEVEREREAAVLGADAEVLETFPTLEDVAMPLLNQ
jgi:hypothetical protein